MSAPTERIAFSGYTMMANDEVKFQVQSQATSSKWTTLGSDATSSSGSLDPSGYRWYPYYGYANLPFGSSSANREYWREVSASNGQRRIRADTRSYSTAYGALYSFDPGATEDCMVNQPNGLMIAQNCHSSSSPEARLYVDCGRADQVCCLANNGSVKRSCQNGRRCNTSRNTCTTPSGGFGQPCNGDNSCSGTGACVRDTCWTKLENAPLFVTKLRIRTGSDGSSGVISVRLNGERFNLNRPGNDFRSNSERTFNISPSDVQTISDIRRLELMAHGSDGVDLTEIDLIANGQTIFTFRGNQRIDGDTTETFTISESQLRNHPSWRPGSACDAPRRISASDLQGKIEGIVGDKLADRSSASWGGRGFVRISQRDSDSIFIDMRVHGDSPVGDADITTRTPLIISCEQTCEGGGSYNPETGQTNYDLTKCTVEGGVFLGAPEVTNIDGDTLFDVLDFVTGGLVSDIASGLARSQGGLELSLGLGSDLPACLGTSFDSDPDLNIDWRFSGLLFSPALPYTIDLAAIDDVLCIDGKPL